MKDKPPADFDWVTARYKCSAATMLELLRDQVRTNVQRWNELEQFERFAFEQTVEVNRYGFKVFDKKGKVRRAVDFGWDGSVIEISLHDGRTLRVSLTLSDDGECKFKVEGAELDAWQVARRALETLLFEA